MNMKIQDVLRKVADMMDGEDSQQMPNQAKMSVVDVDHSDGTDNTAMIPAPQLELELLKKMAGVDNMYDQGDEGEHGEYCDACDSPADECGCDHEDGESPQILDLRKLAGV